MRNVTGSPVTGGDLFGRSREIETLWRRVAANQHALMLAPRRIGKTSLMHELRRAPKPGWVVFYSDLERCDTATDLVADMIAHLASDKRTRTWLDAFASVIPFRHSVSLALRRIKSFGVMEYVRVELADAIASEWSETAKKLQVRLARLPSGAQILFIHDELPILLSKLLKTERGREEAAALLAWLRSLRQDPELAGKVVFLVGGSTSLGGVLRRHNMSAPINDLSAFRVEPWSIDTARAFLSEMGKSYEFELRDEHIAQILSLLGDPVPYHLQLMFQEIRDLASEDVSRVDRAMIDVAFRDRLTGPSGGPYLDHYAERLEHVFSDGELRFAKIVLDTLSRSPGGMEVDAFAHVASESNPRPIIQTLLEEGYLVLEDDVLAFRSNLVREYWRRARSEGRIQ